MNDNVLSSQLSSLENQYGFSYPAVYHQLAKDDMLDSGPKGRDWLKSIFPRLRETPPMLLFAKDFEVLSPGEVTKAMAEMMAPDDGRGISPAFKFVPFGQTGAGDYYCFFFNDVATQNVPVVLVYHDMPEAEYLATNLSDFIFRWMLESVEGVYRDELLSNGDVAENLAAMLRTHHKYLSPRHHGILADVFKREMVSYEVAYGKKTEKRNGLITDIELRALLEKETVYDKIGATFDYSKTS